MRALVAIPLVLAIACSKQTQPMSVHGQRQAILDGIADKCGLPRSTFKLIGDDELHVQPSADAEYERVDCALSELKKAKLPVNMGFVGNEYYVENQQ